MSINDYYKLKVLFLLFLNFINTQSLEIDKENIINEIVKRFRERNTILGENKSVTPEKVLEILTLCK